MARQEDQKVDKENERLSEEMTQEETAPEVPEEKEVSEDETAQGASGAAAEESGAKGPEEKLKELQDQLLRTMAEFDNYRKRTIREKSQSFDLGSRHVIEQILPVLDNFERALLSFGESEDESHRGVRMIYEQLLAVLKNLGCEPMTDIVGKTFDPHFHDAMMHVEDDQYGEGEIVAVLQTGYVMKDTVIRPSLVSVAN